jgi:hypothetical protein
MLKAFLRLPPGLTQTVKTLFAALGTVASKDATGRSHQILIPYDAPVRLTVSSSFFQLNNSAGLPLPRTGPTDIPITVSSGQSPATIRLIVTGGGNK